MRRAYSAVRNHVATFLLILTVASALNPRGSQSPCFMAMSHLQWTFLSFKHWPKTLMPTRLVTVV